MRSQFRRVGVACDDGDRALAPFVVLRREYGGVLDAVNPRDDGFKHAAWDSVDRVDEAVVYRRSGVARADVGRHAAERPIEHRGELAGADSDRRRRHPDGRLPRDRGVRRARPAPRGAVGRQRRDVARTGRANRAAPCPRAGADVIERSPRGIRETTESFLLDIDTVRTVPFTCEVVFQYYAS